MTAGWYVLTRIAYSPSALSNPTNWNLVMAAYGAHVLVGFEALSLPRFEDRCVGKQGHSHLARRSLSTNLRRLSNSILRQTSLLTWMIGERSRLRSSAAFQRERMFTRFYPFSYARAGRAGWRNHLRDGNRSQSC